MAGAAPRRRPQERSAHGADRAIDRSTKGRFAVVAARFNEAISKKLADGAASALEAGGVPGDRVEIHWVPGSFELPQAAMALARTGRYAGIVSVGVVIRGETPHFGYIAAEAAHGLSRVGLETGVPVGFGVITSLTEAQAWERAGGAVGHRGEEAARAVLEMVAWRQELRAGRAAKRRR
jgi:6,7-dimethyl-8-ribityllumazine synthase